MPFFTMLKQQQRQPYCTVPAIKVCGGASREQFKARGQNNECSDPSRDLLENLKTSIDTVLTNNEEIRNSLGPDWKGFFDHGELFALVSDEEMYNYISSVETLYADCKAHVEQLLGAGRKLDLNTCVAKAKTVDENACFHKQDAKLFGFLAHVYGTDLHVASSPDESNISFFAGRQPLKVYDGPGLFSKFLIHAHCDTLWCSQESSARILCQRRFEQTN